MAAVLAMLALAAGGERGRAGAAMGASGGGAMAVPARGPRARALKSTGGHRRRNLPAPHGRCGPPCVRPQVFDIDLYEDGSLGNTDNYRETAAVNAIHAGAAMRSVTSPPAHRELPAPTTTSTSISTAAHGRHSLIGKPFSGRFPNEYWLNLNNNRGQRDFILRQLAARTRKCANAGFDAVEFDNVETYAQPTRVTGWHVSAHTQLIFNTALAKMAHSNGLSVGLKNDLGQVPRLEPKFDFAINEQCFQYHECTNNPSPGYKAFLRDGKPVFQVEYRIPPSSFCSDANRLGISSIKKAKNFSLNAKPLTPCR